MDLLCSVIHDLIGTCSAPKTVSVDHMADVQTAEEGASFTQYHAGLSIVGCCTYDIIAPRG